MLTAIPKNFCSWGFVILQDGLEVAQIHTSWACEGGTLRLGGSVYRLGKAGFLSGEFLLEQDGVRIATAHKSAMMRRFEVEYGGLALVFRAESPLTRGFVLEANGCVMGRVYPNSCFTRRSCIEMPVDMPATVQLWLFWLAALMWRRAAAAAHS